MKKQAVLAFALTIIASFYFSEIIYESALADAEEAKTVEVTPSAFSD